MRPPGREHVELDRPELRLQLQELVAVHYLGCDSGDLDLATSMMLPDVRFTLPPLGEVFENREAVKGGLSEVIRKLPKLARHRPASFRFHTLDPETLRACFTTHIMSCHDGRVHAIGDITVDTVLRDRELRVRAWEVTPVYFRGLIAGGELATLPRLLLTTVPFLLPRKVRKLFAAAQG